MASHPLSPSKVPPQPLERVPSNSTRINAIARLKRAASNREIKGTGGATTTGNLENSRAPSEESSQDYSAKAISTPSPSARRLLLAPITTLTPPAQRTTPSSDGLMDPPPATSPDAASTLQVTSLSRSASASRADGNRSPLPSLEQLRSRILQERLTAGLQRSASAGAASAASAAARAYAMKKLLGHDPGRDGATSPVSDSGGKISDIDEGAEETDEDDEPEISSGSILDRDAKRFTKRGMGSIYLRPPTLSSHSSQKLMLRRSRTISGMSQRAEDERRAAFAQGLDPASDVQPPSPSGMKKKRMSRLPPRRGAERGSVLLNAPLRTTDGTEEAVPALPYSLLDLRGSSDVPETGVDETSNGTFPPAPLTRQPSQREMVRLQMMRKLSGRRLGGPSPIPPSDVHRPQHQNREQDGVAHQEDKVRSRQTAEGGDHDTSTGDYSDSTASPTHTFSQLPHTPVKGDAGDTATITAPQNFQLTPEQQLAFLQMQQLLQQQQRQLATATGHRQVSPLHQQDAFASPTQREVPQTPQTSSRTIGTPRSFSTELHSLGSGGQLSSWESLTGNNLIPSMHFVGEAGLASDRFAHLNLLRSTPCGTTGVERGSDTVVGPKEPVQDWPSSPTVSSYGESARCRFDSFDEGQNSRAENGEQDAKDSGYRDLGFDHTAQPPDPTKSASFFEKRPAHANTGKTTQAPSLLTLPQSTSMRKGAPSSEQSLSPDPRNDSMRISFATSLGDGDHFAFDSALSGNRSVSFLEQYPQPSEGRSSLGKESMEEGISIVRMTTSRKSSDQHQQSTGRPQHLSRQEVTPGDTNSSLSTPQGMLDSEAPPRQTPSRLNLTGTLKREVDKRLYSPYATTPTSDLNDTERIVAWRRWMKAQGLQSDEAHRSDASDVDEPKGVKSLHPAAHSDAELKLTDSARDEAAADGNLSLGRLEHDLAISPTLMKELQLNLDWPGRGPAPASSIGKPAHLIRNPSQQDTPSSNLPTPTGFVRQANGSFFRELDFSPAPALSSSGLPSRFAKTQLMRSDSGSGRRKAPPAFDDGEGETSDERKVSSGSTLFKSPQIGTEAPITSADSVNISTPSENAAQSKLGLGHTPPVEGQSATPLYERRREAMGVISPFAASSRVLSPTALASNTSTAGSSAILTPHQFRQRHPPSAWPASTPAQGVDPPFKTRHHRVPSATDLETDSAFANDKLMPFPGLFRNKSSSGAHSTGGNERSGLTSEDSLGVRSASATLPSSRAVSPTLQRSGTTVGPSSRSQSPFGSIPRFHKASRSLAQTITPWVNPNEDADEGGPGKSTNNESEHISHTVVAETERSRSASPQISLLGSLRRKASNVVRKGSMRVRRAQETSTEESSQGTVQSSSQMMSPYPSISSPLASVQPRSDIIDRPHSLSRGKSVGKKVDPQNTLFRGHVLAQDGGIAVATPGLETASSRLETFNRFDVRPSEHSRSSSRLSPIVISPEPVSSTVRGVPKVGQVSQQSTLPRIQLQSRNSSISSVASSARGERSEPPPESKQALPVGDESLDAGLSAPRPMGGLPPTTETELEPKAAAMLHRYSRVLTSSIKTDLASPDIPPGLTAIDLESPPRQLLQTSPVFQVVNSSTVKDRFLILFNDVLVVAKPISPIAEDISAIDNGIAALPNLQWTFVVKNIMELRHCNLTVPKDQRIRPQPHPLQQVFVEAFARDAQGAVTDIIKRSGLPDKPATIAQLIVQTPALDRNALTEYICSPHRRELLDCFIKLQKVIGVSIESALRMVLMELRFPRDPAAFESLLMAFATHWVTENKHLIKEGFSVQLAADLTFAIMALNDAVHGRSTEGDGDGLSPIEQDYEAPGIFSEPMTTLSHNAFVSAFRDQDSKLVLSDRTLLRIYASVCAEPIQQGLDSSEINVRKAVRVHGSGLPLKLVYGVPSEPIVVSISAVDPDFSVRLYGSDLVFEPPIISFAEDTTRSFTITSRTMGVRQAVFVRSGRSARFYFGSVLDSNASQGVKAAVARGDVSDLPRAAALMVERAFMRNNFTVSLAVDPLDRASETGSSSSQAQSTKAFRKFMFSVDSTALKDRWTRKLQAAIEESRRRAARRQEEISGKQGPENAALAKTTLAADAMALHVLRQALILPDPAVPSTSSGGAEELHRSATTAMSSATRGERHGYLSRTTPAVSQATLARNNTYTPGVSREQQPLSALPLKQQQQSLLDRNVSVSKHYYAPQTGAGRAERDLLAPTLLAGRAGVNKASPTSSAIHLEEAHGDDGGEKNVGSIGATTVRTQMQRRGSAIPPEQEAGVMSGEELITICRQNSLLPIVLQRRDAREGANRARGAL